MATLEEVRILEQEPVKAVSDTLHVMEITLGRELSESEAIELGFDLLELFDALTGEHDDARESS